MTSKFDLYRFGSPFARSQLALVTGACNKHLCIYGYKMFGKSRARKIVSGHCIHYTFRIVRIANNVTL